MRRAVIYVGDMYLVVTTTELIREFGQPLRQSHPRRPAQPNDTPTVVASLAREIASGPTPAALAMYDFPELAAATDAL